MKNLMIILFSYDLFVKCCSYLVNFFAKGRYIASSNTLVTNTCTKFGICPQFVFASNIPPG